MKEIEELLLSLSSLEKSILPFLQLGEAKKISEQAKLDLVSVKRALQFLANKKLVALKAEKKKIVIADVNGILYLRKGLPERKLLSSLIETKTLDFESAKKQSNLSNNEFQIALGTLKEKGIAEIKANKIILKLNKEDAIKKMPEEKFLEMLPLELDALNEEQKSIVKKLQARKAFVRIEEEKELLFETTELGQKVMAEFPKFKKELIEQLDPEMLKKKSWKGKQFRHYDLSIKVPSILGGRRQFYHEFLEEVKEKLVALGFEEMSGNMIINEFWNFDALFQPQFHPAREWTDTYSVKNKLEPLEIDKKILNAVKVEHEKKWHYKWNKEKAMQFILRPQGTVLSALTLASKPKIPGKYFALAKCFRPDVVDASHLTEFNQLEGIVIAKNLNFRHLLGLLNLFAQEIVKAKPQDIRFLPDYYPFTEPSIELDIRKNSKWYEIGGAGIFRDEVIFPLMPEAKQQGIKVLAWGLGIDRLAMLHFGIDDIRELFTKKLELLRGIKIK